MKGFPQLQSQQPGEFLFRGNATAAAGFLTRLDGKVLQLDPNVATTHGESSLPLGGGVSRSLVEQPALSYPQFIRYGACETFVHGGPDGANMVTTLRASVNNIQVTTSPSPEDQVPGVQYMSFRADRVSIAVRSTHPPTGQPSYELIGEPEALGMLLTTTPLSGDSVSVPIRLQFDQSLLALPTLDDLDNAFLGDRVFFDEHLPCFPATRKLVFGKSRVPRTSQGYVYGSIVKQIVVGDQVIDGHVLTQAGFGKISFGVMITNEHSRRISMARIQFGSDPAGRTTVGGVETNGIWK